MIEGQNIICLSSTAYDNPPLVMHHMMNRLAFKNRVLFVEPVNAITSFLFHPELKQYLLKQLVKSKKALMQINQNLFVYTPPMVPIYFGHLRFSDKLIQTFLPRAVQRRAIKLGITDPILWAYDPFLYIPHGLFHEKLVVYDCNDELSSMHKIPRKRMNLKKLEDRFISKADVIFTTSQELLNLKSKRHRHVHFFPSGIEVEQIQNCLAQGDSQISELRSLPSPMVGYVGVILSSRINWSWVYASAKKYPSWSFVYVGPVSGRIAKEVLDLNNVYFLGPRPSGILPKYIVNFDVCIIPYYGDEFLKYCFPTKFFEYLACGKPVVSAMIPALQDFAQCYLAKTEAQYLEGLKWAINKKNDDSFIESCKSVASQNSWEMRIAGASAAIDRALAKRTVSTSDNYGSK